MDNNGLLNTDKLKNAASMQEALPFVWEALQAKVDKMIVQIGNKSPHVAKADGIYDDMRVDWWTSGFWPGLLWIMHEMSGKEHYKNAAWDWDEIIEKKMIQNNNFHHDVGFQFLPTAVIKHKLTGDA